MSSPQPSLAVRREAEAMAANLIIAATNLERWARAGWLSPRVLEMVRAAVTKLTVVIDDMTGAVGGEQAEGGDRHRIVALLADGRARTVRQIATELDIPVEMASNKVHGMFYAKRKMITRTPGLFYPRAFVITDYGRSVVQHDEAAPE